MIANYHLTLQQWRNGILPALIRTYQAKGHKSFMSDEMDLPAGMRDLDPQTITRIHETFFPAVYRYAHYRIGDETIAEDLASETFIRLLEAIHAGKGPKSSLRGWLMGTISNLINDYFRNLYKKTSKNIPEGFPTLNGDPVSMFEKTNQHEILRAGLSKLTSDQQHVLALRFGSGYSLAETADVMRKKPNAIKQLQFRALAALRKQIEGEL